MKIVRAGHGLTGDIHEFKLLPGNRALFTIYRKVPADLSEFGGPSNGFVLEGVVREISIPTGRVLFEWHSLPDVNLPEAYLPIPEHEGTSKSPYDYFHIHSADLDCDGNVVGWGQNAYFTEYSAAGLDSSFGDAAPNIDSYRAFRFPWVGTPTTKPAAVARSSGGVRTVSWNGATQVALWEVLGGPDAGHLAPVASAPKSGFETAIPVRKSARTLFVVARDAEGTVLARAAVH